MEENGKILKRGLAKLTYTGLGALLNLPDGHKVIDVFDDRSRNVEAFNIIIEGETCPTVHEGEEIPWIIFEIAEDGTTKIE